MIGVLAIIAALAALLLPALIKRMHMATRTQEAANLVAIREALLLRVLRNETIPDHTTWQTAAADWSKLLVWQIATNTCRYRRLYFLESGPNPASLPYAQTSAGTTRPAKLRAIVVSILAGAPLNSTNCPAPDGGYLSDGDFNALWNTPEGGRPIAGAWANWNGAGDDFLAQRIDYAPSFHHLVLVNRDAVSPSFTLNGSSPITVANNTNNNVGWDSYYLDGSVVDLCDTNGTTMTRHVLTRDISFVFEDGSWRTQIMGLSTGNYLADDFGDKAAAFLAANWYSGAFKGADQQAALVAMYSFMCTYTLWANQWPHFPSHGISSAEQVPEFLMLKSVADANKPLDAVTGASGLLK
jgi:type II secretory pathway pseudopilin PulG